MLVYVDLVPSTDAKMSPRFEPQLEMFITKAENLEALVLEVSPSGILAVFGINSLEDQPRRAAAVATTILKTAERAPTTPWAVKAAIHVDEFLIARRAHSFWIDVEGKFKAWRLLKSLLVHGGDSQAILLTRVAAPLFQTEFRVVPLAEVQHVLGPIYRLTLP